MSAAQVAADLRAAVEVLKRDGWCRNVYTDDDGCHCLMGALFTVHGDPHGETIAVDRALGPHREILASFLGKRPTSWNDFYANDVNEVIAALEVAADAAEATQGSTLGKGQP